jgi:hypothetical protein
LPSFFKCRQVFALQLNQLKNYRPLGCLALQTFVGRRVNLASELINDAAKYRQRRLTVREKSPIACPNRLAFRFREPAPFPERL